VPDERVAADAGGSRMQLLDVTLQTYQAPWYAGWGTLALVNAGLAQSKNRSGLIWFLVSLICGPLATLLIVVLEPVPRG
jgi:hypothetical protein